MPPHLYVYVLLLACVSACSLAPGLPDEPPALSDMEEPLELAAEPDDETARKRLPFGSFSGMYLGDARALQLPLVAPGMGMMPAGDGPIMHDWNHLLGISGLLRHDTTIAMMIRAGAIPA